MNILYVSVDDLYSSTGGSYGRRNNYHALKMYSPDFFAYLIPLKENKLRKIFDTLLGYKSGLSAYHIRMVLNVVYLKAIDVVFLDTSLYGKLAKKLKARTRAKVVAFFHNCEYMLYKQALYNKLMLSFLLRSVYVNESLTVIYADRCIFLTQRDYDDCSKLYKKECRPYFTPIALECSYHKEPSISFNHPKKLLFVGSYFYPNVEGLIWFINLVLPTIDYTLTIVGKGFEKGSFISELIDTSKVEIKGYIHNLDSEYENADIVIQPVFKGSGMKTKTAECFMYGKPLVSTSEGLIGYIDDEEYIYRCDTADMFINTLKDLQKKTLPSFCKNLRDLYDNNYSLDVRARKYKKILSEI